MPIGGKKAKKKESLLGSLTGYVPGAVKPGGLVQKGEAIQDHAAEQDLLKVPNEPKVESIAYLSGLLVSSRGSNVARLCAGQ